MKQRAEISVGFESGVGGNVGYRLVCVNQPFLDLREPVLYYVFGDCHACVLLEYTAEMEFADIDRARYHIERQPAAVVLLDKFEHLFGSRVARRIRWGAVILKQFEQQFEQSGQTANIGVISLRFGDRLDQPDKAASAGQVDFQWL